MKARDLITVNDLEGAPEDGNRYEVIDGELHVSSSPSRLHQLLLHRLSFLLQRYLEDHPIGELVPGVGVIFDEFNGVIPDLVFYSNERKKRIVSERLTGAPELVVEIISPGSKNEQRDRKLKKGLYSENGVSEYWIIDREARMIEVYRAARTGGFSAKLVLRENDLLQTPLLPGFSCEVKAILPQD